jgi:hypothetical protein
MPNKLLNSLTSSNSIYILPCKADWHACYVPYSALALRFLAAPLMLLGVSWQWVERLLLCGTIGCTWLACADAVLMH